ncbi:hypothetical protein WA026_017409 [Henosepilachna vigintioctopunctata]|uniref:Nuclear envelope membrane protein n=1 Tax=Henosepilachna vigintioctopunctata TaxID=420089 RepID=A0AAW1VB63_9CUCU
MEPKKLFINIIKCIICCFGLIFTFFSIIALMLFLSDPYKKRLTGFPRKDVWLSISWSLFIDMLLISTFIVQHSVLASSKIKLFFKRFGLEDLYRSFYIISTSLVLQVLISNWLYIPEITIWKLNLNYKPVWWLYFGIHTISWILIYVGNICMDVNELLGIKQVIYSMKNLPDPNRRKSQELKNLSNHLRHPSFLAFTLLFWMNSTMSLDQLLLATIFSSYMYVAWNTDHDDYIYQKNQYLLKFHELQKVQS